MAAVVLPWLILDLTASTTLAAIAASAALATVLLVSFAGALLIDRYGAKATAIMAGLMRGLCVAQVPVAAFSGPAAAWAIVGSGRGARPCRLFTWPRWFRRTLQKELVGGPPFHRSAFLRSSGAAVQCRHGQRNWVRCQGLL
jgi:MFS family permease